MRFGRRRVQYAEVNSRIFVCADKTELLFAKQTVQDTTISAETHLILAD